MTERSGEGTPTRLTIVAILVLILTSAALGCGGGRATGSGETTGPQRMEDTRGDGAAQGGQQQEEDVFTPVTVSLIGDDSEGAVKGTDGRYHVVYE